MFSQDASTNIFS